MSELRRAAAKAPVLLVRGDFGLREVHDALLDSTGVRSAKAESEWRQRPAVSTTSSDTSVAMPSLIAWNDIASLETQHPQKLKGALFGGVTGLAISMLIVGLNNETNTSEGFTRSESLALGMPFLGVTTGFIVGAFAGTRTIYPQHESHEVTGKGMLP
jgi:hypothetical protein